MFLLLFVYLTCGPRQRFFFQCGPEMPQGGTPISGPCHFQSVPCKSSPGDRKAEGAVGLESPLQLEKASAQSCGEGPPGSGRRVWGHPGGSAHSPPVGPRGKSPLPSPEHAAWLLEEKPVEGQAPLSRSSPQILTGPERLLKRCEGRESKRNIDVRNISTRTGDPTRHLPVVYWIRLQPAGPHLPGTVSGIWRLLLQVLVAAFLRLSRFQGSCSPRSLRRVKKITDTVCPDFSCRKDGNDHI